MSMQPGALEVRPAGAGGKPDDATPLVEQQRTEVKGTATGEKVPSERMAPAAERVEERQAARDARMDNLERRLNDVCSLLENLVIDRGAGGSYYGGEEGTPSPMTGGTHFEYQEPPLFSTPSGAVRGQAPSAGVARAVPGRERGVSPANNHPTIY
ncbi:hypothetical protein GGI05_001944 [Coemansia sp. RSA 2603]|nr:hypothetical protein GGI05_001944 [Coemansia sp. RSA 2603]